MVATGDRPKRIPSQKKLVVRLGLWLSCVDTGSLVVVAGRWVRRGWPFALATLPGWQTPGGWTAIDVGHGGCCSVCVCVQEGRRGDSLVTTMDVLTDLFARRPPQLFGEAGTLTMGQLTDEGVVLHVRTLWQQHLPDQCLPHRPREGTIRGHLETDLLLLEPRDRTDPHLSLWVPQEPGSCKGGGRGGGPLPRNSSHGSDRPQGSSGPDTAVCPRGGCYAAATGGPPWTDRDQAPVR